MSVTGTIPDVRTSARESDSRLDVVTGAFSYSGRAIANALIEHGRRVRTLTGHPHRADPGTVVDVRPLDFDDLPGLVSAMEGAATLYNTYWVRFAHGRVDHHLAIENSKALFFAARRAGVGRIVHMSITNARIDSPYPYFRGKALVERALAETGVPYAILRPAILFGSEGVLINNIAWLLRRLPVFAVGGDAAYRIRGIHVDDLAELALAAAELHDDTVVDAVGPERPTFLELVQTVRAAVHSRSRIVHVAGPLVPVLAACLNRALGDVLLTRDEYRAMADGLADTTTAATGHTALSVWIAANASTLGTSYANELQRHFRP